jgi:hypothetical protein
LTGAAISAKPTQKIEKRLPIGRRLNRFGLARIPSGLFLSLILIWPRTGRVFCINEMAHCPVGDGGKSLMSLSLRLWWHYGKHFSGISEMRSLGGAADVEHWRRDHRLLPGTRTSRGREDTPRPIASVARLRRNSIPRFDRSPSLRCSRSSSRTGRDVRILTSSGAWRRRRVSTHEDAGAGFLGRLGSSERHGERDGVRNAPVLRTEVFHASRRWWASVLSHDFSP